MKVLFSVLFVGIALSSSSAYPSCREILVTKGTASEHVEPIEVWLQIDEYDLMDAVENGVSAFSVRFFNPRTGDTKYLPTGWLNVGNKPVSDDQPWIRIRKPVSKGVTTYNFVNIKTGEILLSPSYPEGSGLSSASDFRDGYAIVQKGGDSRYYLLGLNGQVIPVDASVNWMTEASEGLYPARAANSRSVYVNSQGQIVDPGFQSGLLVPQQRILRLSSLKGGLALFSVGRNNGYDPSERFGYMDRHFVWQIPPRFKEAESFYNGRAWAKEDKFWGIVNPKGEWIVQPKFVSHSQGDTSEFFIASEGGASRVYDGKGQFVFDLPGEAKLVNYAFIEDGLVFLPRGGSGGNARYFNLRQRKWLGDFNYNVKNGFVNGYAFVEIVGAADASQKNAFAEAYLRLDGKIEVLMIRHGKVEELLLPPGALRLTGSKLP